MSPRPSRREELIEAALAAFMERGYEATSIGRLAKRTGLSKAAFSYHFETKEALLEEIATPLVDELETVQERHPKAPAWPDEVKTLLEDYVDALLAYADVVTWIDGDKSVLNHPELGKRLRSSNLNMRRALCGGVCGGRARVQAAAVIGMLWRPLRNLDTDNVAEARESLVALAVEAVGTVRSAASATPA